MTPAAPQTRPRVEGEREQEIYDATLAVLREVGHDRLTMDAVAAEAKASKATLYRRWSSKTALVIEALAAAKGSDQVVPDQGSLRADLIASFCSVGSITNPDQVALLSSVLTAMTRDPEFAERYRTEVIGPKVRNTQAIFERARDRGELRDDADPGLLGPALPGILLHRYFMLGETPTREAVERIVDQVILPACRPAPPAHHDPTEQNRDPS